MSSHAQFVVIALLLAGVAYGYNGYNQDHGPFADNFDAPRLDLQEVPLETTSLSRTNSDIVEIMFSTNKPVRTQIRVSYSYGPMVGFVEIFEGERRILPKTALGVYVTAGAMMAFTGDLNMDDRRDFVIFAYSGGCGLACGFCNVAFILSDSNNTYRVTTVETLFPDACEFLVLKGKPCFVHTSFDGVVECKDGKTHNFWVYNLLAFDGGHVRIQNDVYPGFPKIVWYSFKPNHKETDLLSSDQKDQMKRASVSGIFWRHPDSQPKGEQGNASH